MKRIVLLFSVIMIAVLISSCESRSGRLTKQKAEWQKTHPVPPVAKATPGSTKSDTLVVIPEAFGASKIEIDFTPYPKYDGGEGYEVSFTIGIKLKGENKSRSIAVSERAFGPYVGAAKEKENIKKAISLHFDVTHTNAENIQITLFKNNVVKIVEKELWVGKTFTPEKVIWQDKNYPNDLGYKLL